MSEGFVEVAGWLLQDSNGDVDAGGAEFFDAAAADEWVGIAGGDDYAGDAGGDESVGAGAGAAVMAAGLEGDVGCGATGGVAERGGLFEGRDLGVVVAVVDVGAFADDSPERRGRSRPAGWGWRARWWQRRGRERAA